MKFLVGNLDNLNSYSTYKRAAAMPGNPFPGLFNLSLRLYIFELCENSYQGSVGRYKSSCDGPRLSSYCGRMVIELVSQGRAKTTKRPHSPDISR